PALLEDGEGCPGDLAGEVLAGGEREQRIVAAVEDRRRYADRPECGTEIACERGIEARDGRLRRRPLHLRHCPGDARRRRAGLEEAGCEVADEAAEVRLDLCSRRGRLGRGTGERILGIAQAARGRADEAERAHALAEPAGELERDEASERPAD